jgi:hypothetical protein
MEQPWRELAQRDAKVIRAGIATALVAILAGVASLFAGPLVGGLAAAAGFVVQLNAVFGWLAGPRWMAERRLVLAPGVVAGIAVALGANSVFGGAAAIVASLPAAALATIVLGMTIAGHRGD